MSQLRKRISSFKWAFNGLKIMVQAEPNARIHLVATICVVIMALFFGIQRHEWIAVILAIAMVWSAELLNTAIERLADFVSPERRAIIKQTKDLAAAAVLVVAIAAAVIGLIIFVPYILYWIETGHVA